MIVVLIAHFRNDMCFELIKNKTKLEIKSEISSPDS